MDRRIEFSNATKSIIAGRAGYRCSMPACRAVTIGPGHTAQEVALTGVACHIFSARARGPRGQGGLSPKQLSNATNGIWMCQNHGRLVDTNDGGAYPASLLISLRNLHEAWVIREQGGISGQFGWIQQIEIFENPLFISPSIIRLGKVTVIIGANGTGKTALCEWLIGATDPTPLRRWFDPRQHLRYRVTYYAPFEHQVLIENQYEEVLYSIDGRAVPYNPLPFRVVTLSAPSPDWKKKTDLGQIAELLHIDKVIVRNLLGRRDPTNRIYKNAKIEATETVRLDVNGTAPGLRWRSLSAGEQVIVAIEIAIIMAKFMSQYYPTMLILDWGISKMDCYGLPQVANRLSSSEIKFQSIIATFEREGMIWDGWQKARFNGSPPNVAIGQENILI